LRVTARSASGALAGSEEKGPKSDNQCGAALLSLLVYGLNDKAIMHELGVSHRAVSRRIVELMEGVGAITRFQAGWLAARAADRCDGE